MIMNILLVEDDEIIASGLCYALEGEGYSVTYCDSVAKAIIAVTEKNFDLGIIDIGLPDGSGFDICKQIKLHHDTAIIFLTAVDDEGNTVKGFDMGADDYISKPFRLRELLSRVKAVLRRHEGIHSDIVCFGDIMINTRLTKATQNGKELELTAIEYRLLLHFATHKGQTLTRKQILDSLWDGAGSFVNDNTLTVYIKRLRKKIGDSFIQTVRGVGYRA
jgi:DNA-binding response OmpR family regulator